MKVIKAKNGELKMKLEAWKRREDERRRVKRRFYDHGKKLREVFEKFSKDFNIEKEKVIECIIDYNKFVEDKERLEKEEKIVSDFLCQIPGFSDVSASASPSAS